ncbi:MAG TPA: type VI secretion system baseplate subunit TssK [Pirellulales bacterium]|jgi:type VI secretion system protein ImpJ|nr:type VI secretion system baseplate subunit TssK [Pirellulales bacterium]
MRNPAVHWCEGMFLRPQHFQAADRNWSEVLQVSEQWDHTYNYGIRRLEISDEALANFTFQVNVCHARCKDGTLVVLESGNEPDRLDLHDAIAQATTIKADLKDSFESETTVRLYLGIPKLKLGVSNVANDGVVGKHRYSEFAQQLQDESLGGNDQEVRLKVLNVRLLVSTEDLSGYEVLPIAQIQRAGGPDATPKLDTDFIPPMLAIDAWPPLSRDIVRVIYDTVGKHAEMLAGEVVFRGEGLVVDQPGDLERVMMLSKLNAAYATLGILTMARGIHPLVAYTELARIVGELSIFGPERRCPDIPRYDHDDLARIFKWVKEQIDLLLSGRPTDQYEMRPFMGMGRGMQVALEAKWFSSDWRWYVGVLHENSTDDECRDLLEKDTLHWKLGSKTQVDTLFEHRLPGLSLSPLKVTPRALPARGGWSYYEVSREGAAWKDVQLTKTLAMRFKETSIENLAKLPGSRQLVVNFKGRHVDLEFALFAVRSNA